MLSSITAAHRSDGLHNIETITGFTPRSIISDSRIHRFGKNKCCWYVAYSSGVITCGNWQTGVKDSFCNHSENRQSLPLPINNSVSIAKERERLAYLQKNKMDKQRRIWATANQADNSHAYLRAKRVRAFGLRQMGKTLLIPIRNINGSLQALQHISPNGTKRIYASYKRCFHHIGVSAQSNKIFIGEGYATMATLYEATGIRSVIAFSTSNLVHCGLAIRNLYPDIEIVFCADNDGITEKKIGVNPGIEYARKTAKRCSGKVLIPEFEDGQSGSDFNDLLNLSGVSDYG